MIYLFSRWKFVPLYAFTYLSHPPTDFRNLKATERASSQAALLSNP